MRRIIWQYFIFALLCCCTVTPSKCQVTDEHGLSHNPWKGVATELAPAAPFWDPGAGEQSLEVEPLVVATLDGTLHAVDADSGRLQWSFSSGPPLVSASQKPLAEDAGGDAHGGLGDHEEGIVFPGADGSLYAYRRGHGVQRLPLSARQLVDASPSIGHDGAIIVGARHSTIFVVDATTGRLLRKLDGQSGTVSSEPEATESPATITPSSGEVGDVEDCVYVGGVDKGEGGEIDSAAHTAAEGPSHMRCQGSLFLVRTDYTVKSMDAASGEERWNVSVGELSTLYQPPSFSNPPKSTWPAPVPTAGWGGGVLAGQMNPNLLMLGGKENSLQKLDPSSGREEWQVTFPAPPVAIFSPRGELLKELMPGGQGRGGLALPRPREAPPMPALPAGVAHERGGHGDDLLPPRSSVECAPGDVVCDIERMGATNRTEPPALPAGSPREEMSWGGGVVVVVGVFAAVPFAWWVWGKYSQARIGPRPQVKSPAAKRKKARRSNADKDKAAGPLEKADAESALNGKEGKLENGRSLQGGSEEQENGAGGGNGRRSKRGEDGGGEAGTWVGRLWVAQQKVIGYGSHGTIVLEGRLEGRTVAVKRLLAQFYERAEKEIANLILSDEHPNVVRCYAMEEDADFVYVALERCRQSLSDLILGFAANHSSGASSSSSALDQPKALLNGDHSAGSASSMHPPLPQGRTRPGPGGQEWVLWDERERPTEKLVGLMRDVVAGLAHLHALGIVHRDLKPQNVLLSAAGRAKLSDMGISKRLAGEQSSFDPHATGAGTSGWQAPEQLLEGRQTRAVDLFSLGCVLFFCLTGGRHPFGQRFERDSNVLRGQIDLFPIAHLPEAEHLVGLLLDQNPQRRPTALEALAHPLFWSAEQRLAFLRDASDRVELEDREAGSQLFADMEAVGPTALGGLWDAQLDQDLLDNLGKYRRYNSRSVRDLLRVIRNKSNHYRELPQHVQDLLGPIPEGFVDYFTTRFPHLLMEVYSVLLKYCKDEDHFRKFFYPPEAALLIK